jgi:hypothetical protein
MRYHLFTGLCVVLGTLLAVSPALADHHKFAPIPPDQTGGKASGMELRIVKYDGATNGVLEVEVKNTRPQMAQFSARGLYFVPESNANQAPQRLGAVGPFSLETEQGWQRRDTTTIPSGGVARLKLDVYCIDSHRSSPGPATGFRVAKERMPKHVSDQILEGAAAAAAPLGGVSSPRAKGVVQSQVWKHRDDNWIELDGEGKQEAGKSKR